MQEYTITCQSRYGTLTFEHIEAENEDKAHEYAEERIVQLDGGNFNCSITDTREV
jgi:hypothetical protein